MILYKFASRSRPDKFFNCLDNIKFYAREKYIILASLDLDDKTMNNDDVGIRMGTCENLIYVFGESNNKIHAINRDINQVPEWDILINMSDDMLFTAPGFDTIIQEDMIESFEEMDGTIHYPDGNRDDLITMSIMGRKYYDRFGYIYHPSYKSLWCDNEFTEVAKILGKHKYIGRQIFKHNHPAYDMKYWDEQYGITESFNDVDRNNYLKRKNINFELPIK